MIQSTLNFIYYAIIIVLTFGLAVFVHEFGHMIFALIRGVGVESFAIGMGPKICQWYWGGIEFSLRWIPAGGFVKLKGMIAEEEPTAANPENTNVGGGLATVGDVDVDKGPAAEDAADGKKTVAESSYDDLLALSNQGLLTKLLVFGGGVFMNYVTAIVAMAVLSTLPKKWPQVELIVNDIRPESAATAPPFQPSDQIIGLNGQPLRYEFELSDALNQLYTRQAEQTKQSPDQVKEDLTFTVKRGDQQVPVALGNLTLQECKARLNAIEFRLPPIVGAVTWTKPADKAGIRAGDKILAIDGRAITSYNEVVEIVKNGLGKELTFDLERKSKAGAPQHVTVKVKPEQHYADPTQGLIGVESGAVSEYVEPGLSVKDAILQAWPRTNAQLFYLVDQHIEFFKKATFSQIKNNMGGPIMIAGMTKSMAERGFTFLVSWFVSLNLMLMVFNLLPLPVLDGGFILLSIIEAVIRRPVPPRVLAPIYTGFVVLFITLMVVISVLDVRRWLF